MISSTPPASGRKVFGEATNKNIEKVQAVKPKSILPAFHLVSDYADLPPEVPHPPPPRAARRRSKPAGLCGKCQVQYGRGREASDVWAALLHCSRATHALQALNPPDYGSDPAMMLTDFSAITSGASLHSSDPLYKLALTLPSLHARCVCGSPLRADLNSLMAKLSFDHHLSSPSLSPGARSPAQKYKAARQADRLSTECEATDDTEAPPCTAAAPPHVMRGLFCHEESSDAPGSDHVLGTQGKEAAEGPHGRTVAAQALVHIW